jgi:tetratricopeptide (TPR) repeat protein
MTIEPQKPNITADTIYSSVIGHHATVTQTIVQPPRKANLFQLSQDDSDFTERSQYTNQIKAILTSTSPVAMISGMGGVGKSVLAKHVGNLLKDLYPDGQLFVDLRGQSELPRTPIAVLTDFLVDGFGCDPQYLPSELEALRGIYQHQLSDRKILLVLDNAQDGAQVEPLLPRVAGCGAIVTSREALTNLAGMTAQNFVQLGVMTIDEAIALLDRLCPNKTNNRDLTTELAKLCGQLPLALTIVGKLLLGTISLTMAKLVAELKVERSRLRVLKYRNNQDVVDPTLDVEASFNLSYGRLLPEQQQVFEAVAVLRGTDFGVELAAVLGEMEAAQVQRRLDQLVSLAIVQVPEGKDDRYRLHDLMREFGREKLVPEREAVLAGKALDWYAKTADQMDDFVQATLRSQRAASIAEDSDQSIAEIDAALLSIGFAWFEVEWLNIIEGIKWAKITGRAELAVKLFGYGMHFAALQGKRNLVLLKAGEQALEAARSAGARLGEANTLQAIADVLQFKKRSDEALVNYEQAMLIYREVGARLGEANTLQAIADVLQFKKRSDEALVNYEQAMLIYREVGDRLGEANTLKAIGLLLSKQGDHRKAVPMVEQSLKIYRDIGDRYSQATALQNLAVLYNQTGRVKEGFALGQEATEIFTELGLLSYAFPKWINNIIQFAQKGRNQMVFCFIGGIFAFPFMLVFFITLTLWRLTIGRFRR